MKKITVLSLFVISIAIALISCEKDSPLTPNTGFIPTATGDDPTGGFDTSGTRGGQGGTNSSYTISARISGQNKTFNNVDWEEIIDPTFGDFISIFSDTNSTDVFGITFDSPLAAKTYDIDPLSISSNNQAIYATITSSNDTLLYFSTSGSITVSEINGDVLKGTFNFVMAEIDDPNMVVNVQNGIFEAIKK